MGAGGGDFLVCQVQGKGGQYLLLLCAHLLPEELQLHLGGSGGQAVKVQVAGLCLGRPVVVASQVGAAAVIRTQLGAVGQHQPGRAFHAVLLQGAKVPIAPEGDFHRDHRLGGGARHSEHLRPVVLRLGHEGVIVAVVHCQGEAGGETALDRLGGDGLHFAMGAKLCHLPL